MDIGSYRGYRHRRGLPSRGQNTKNNARTRRVNQRDLRIEQSTDPTRGRGLYTDVPIEKNSLIGIITDGDIRRRLVTEPDLNLIQLTASDVMTTAPLTISRSALAVDALRQMEQSRVTSLVVVHNGNRLAGFLHLHDLWQTNLF